VTSAPAALALSAECYQQIVRALKSDGGRHFNENRARPRVGVRGRVQIAPLRPDGHRSEIFDVWVRDLSARGMGILHTRPLHPGVRFDAIFHRADAGPLVLTYVVVQVKSVDDGMYTLGAQLTAIDPRDSTPH
jgi:hypothetical protein